MSATDLSVTKETTSVRGWAIVTLFSQLTSFGAVVSFTLGVMLPVITEELKLRPMEIGALASIGWITTSVTAIPFSAWFSRYNPVKLVAIAGIASAFCVALQAYAMNFATLFLARFAFVLVQSSKNPARVLVIRQWMAPNHIAWANGFLFSLHSVIQALALSVVAVIVIALGGWRPTYIAMGSFLGLLTVVWMVIARQRKTVEYQQLQVQEQGKTPLGALFRYPEAWLVAGANLVPHALWGAFLTFLPTFLIKYRDMPLPVAGLTTGLLYWGTAVASVLGGVASRWIPSPRLPIVLSGLIFAGAGLVVISSSSAPLVGLAAFCLGLGWIIMPYIQTLPFQLPKIKPREIAVVTGLINMSSGVGFALGPFLSGIIVEMSGSLYLAFIILVLSCLSMAATWPVYPRKVGQSERTAVGRGT